ncbi:FadR/GntR family transcriptional regulator [Leeia oryzae]|uniref:FadR/GntR family transcriptional regulator n=1 Tax=Leeia oryzae TaxID=356662 RepID=UPI000477BC4D|nr:FadR/GntR family transcriptional regulator [Leeia oryzae]
MSTSAMPIESIPDNFKPKQIYEQVAARIRTEIQSGRFAPESRLPSERELSSRFKVSRPAVREALGALQNEGLVITKPGSGTYVAAQAQDLLLYGNGTEETSGKEADFSPSSMLDTRLILEPGIARLAARQGRRDATAEHYLKLMGKIVDINDPEQRALWNECDRMFHRQLAVMTGDALLVKIADEIAKGMDQALWQRLKNDSIYDLTEIQLYIAEHRLIYEAVTRGDENAAAFYLEQHIQRVRRDIAPS